VGQISYRTTEEKLETTEITTANNSPDKRIIISEIFFEYAHSE